MYCYFTIWKRCAAGNALLMLEKPIKTFGRRARRKLQLIGNYNMVLFRFV